MTARSISIEAYEKHVQSGKQLTQWQRIYMYLLVESHKGHTRAELSEMTNIRVASVCGRVNELIKAGMITEGDRRKCSVTGSHAYPLTVKHQRDLF